MRIKLLGGPLDGLEFVDEGLKNTKRFRTYARPVPDAACLQIVDSAKGIDPDRFNRLFEYQLLGYLSNNWKTEEPCRIYQFKEQE